MPSQTGRSYTAPQRRMLTYLSHKARTPRELQDLVSTSASGVSRIANHVRHLIEYDHRRGRFRIRDERYSEVLEMRLRWEGAIE